MPHGIHFLAPIAPFVYIFLLAECFLNITVPVLQESIVPLVNNRYFIIFSLGASSLFTLIFFLSMAIQLHCVMTFFFIISLVLFSNLIFCMATTYVPNF
jgi:hypothetical protein